MTSVWTAVSYSHHLYRAKSELATGPGQHDTNNHTGTDPLNCVFVIRAADATNQFTSHSGRNGHIVLLLTDTISSSQTSAGHRENFYW